MSEFKVHASFTVKNEETFLRDAKSMISATQGEKGCIHCALYEEIGGASKSYAIIETWASIEDLYAHSKSDHVNTFQDKHEANWRVLIKVQGWQLGVQKINFCQFHPFRTIFNSIHLGKKFVCLH